MIKYKFPSGKKWDSPKQAVGYFSYFFKERNGKFLEQWGRFIGLISNEMEDNEYTYEDLKYLLWYCFNFKDNVNSPKYCFFFWDELDKAKKIKAKYDKLEENTEEIKKEFKDNSDDQEKDQEKRKEELLGEFLE